MNNTKENISLLFVVDKRYNDVTAVCPSSNPLAGLEPAVTGLEDRCAIHLRHSDIKQLFQS